MFPTLLFARLSFFKGHVLPSIAPDIYSFRLAASLLSLDILPVSAHGLFVRIQAYSPLSLPCYRPAEIR